MASETQILKDMARAFTNTDPVTIQAAITDFCFNKCIMCDHYKRDDKKYINSIAWIEFLMSLKDTKTIFYTGGDSMMHPDINDIMEAHVNLDIDFGFITSGYIPESIDMQLLAQAKFFNVSLDSINKEVYKILRGGISLDKVLESIESALDYGVNVNATVVLSKENIDEIDDIAQYCLSRKMNIRLNHLYGESDKPDRDFTLWANVFSENDLVFNVKDESYNFNKCIVPYYSMFIDSSGDVYPCCVIGGDTELKPNAEKLGNISDFEKAKEYRRLFFTSKLPDKCKNCLPSFQKINNIFSYSPTINFKIEESRNFY